KLASDQAHSTAPTLQNITSAVNLSLQNNNFTPGTNCTVTVNWPPQSGSFNADANSVEVKLKFTYSNLIVGGGTSVTVRSVASCAPAGSPTQPMLITDPSAANAFWVNNG